MIEEKFMVRCLELAKRGISSVSPNPMVGAVVVHQGRIIGEGFHRLPGTPHAEVHALNAVEDESLCEHATLYVSLEPCSHHGKTPPCVDLIIKKRIPRVVIACLDPYPAVSGRGVARLRAAGVEVITGMLEEEARHLNRFFMTAHTLHRPFVLLKWAQSKDGYVDRCRTSADDPPLQLSPTVTRRLVHKVRSEVSAIMVGTNTACLDNPSLTVRHWSGDSPVRVVLDRSLRIPASYHLLDGTVRTLVFTEHEQVSRPNVEYVTIDFSRPIIPTLLDHLYRRELHSLLVEGGPSLHRHFFDEGLWDELVVETAPLTVGSGVRAPDLRAVESLAWQRSLFFSYNKKDQQSEIALFSRRQSP